MNTSWIEHDFSQEAWAKINGREKGMSLIQQLATLILHNPSPVRSSLDAVYDYLSETDALTDGEVIFTFASASPLCLDKALELYRDFLPRELVFSGQGSGRHGSAAQTYRDLAIQAGVPPEFITRELRGTTLLESVRETLDLFEEMQWSVKRLIVVNTPHRQRRGWCLFKKHLPDTVALLRQNSMAEKGYDRETWFTHQEGIDEILGEFLELKEGVVTNVV